MTPSIQTPKLVQYQIVVGALAFGLMCFSAVALFFVSSGRASVRSPAAPAMFVSGAVLLIGGFVAGLVVRRVWVGRLQRRGPSLPIETDEVLQAFGTVTIVRSALAEGPGLLFLITYMVSGMVLALAGAALAVAALLAVFPTPRTFEAFAGQVLDQTGFTPR